MTGTPTRHQLDRSNDNTPFAYILSGETLFAPASDREGYRLGTVTGGDIVNYGAIGAEIVFDVDISGAHTLPTIQLAVESKDPASGKYTNITSGSALITDAVQVIRIHPSFNASGGQVITAISDANIQYISGALPRNWRIRVTNISGGTAVSTWTKFTVGVNPFVR